ncbi:unnamed protein product, partial [Closterium sp. NIES-53]
MASLRVLVFDHEGSPSSPRIPTGRPDPRRPPGSPPRAPTFPTFSRRSPPIVSSGAPPPPLSPPTPLLLLLTSLVLRTLGLLLLVGSAAAVRARVAGVVAVVAGVVVGAAVELVEAVEVVAVVGVVSGEGALVVAVVAAVGVVAVGLELLSVEVLAVARRSSSSVGARPHHPSSFVSGFLIVGRLQFGDEAERPRWAEMLRYGVAIFGLDYDAILAAMHALFVSAEGDCYPCVPPDP